MTCDKIEDRLPAYMEDLLTAGERKIVAGHLASCPRCSGALARLKKTEQLLQGLGEVEPPPFFEQRIMSRVRQEAGRKRTFLRRLFYPLHVKVPIQALASLLVAVIAIHVYQAGEPEMQRIAPLSVPMAERAKEQAGDAAGQPVSPPVPLPARQDPARDLPDMEGKPLVTPLPEKGVTSPRSADIRAPVRKEPLPAPGEADPPSTVRERGTAPVVTTGREQPPEPAKRQEAEPAVEGLPAEERRSAPLRERGADRGAPVRDARPPAPREAEPPVAVRERETAPDPAQRQAAERAAAGIPAEEKRSAMPGDRGAAARDGAEMASAPPPPQMAGRAAVEKRSAIDLTIQVADAAAAVREIEARIGRVHARITEKRLSRGSALLKVETEASNVAALLDLLRTIGRENIETGPLAAPEGRVTVNIQIVGRP